MQMWLSEPQEQSWGWKLSAKNGEAGTEARDTEGTVEPPGLLGTTCLYISGLQPHLSLPSMHLHTLHTKYPEQTMVL